MKRKLLSVLICLALIFSMVSVCSAEETQTSENGVDYREIYADTLNRYFQLLANGTEIEEDTGVSEARIFGKPDELLTSIGFAIQDLSGDGIPELVIGYVPDPDSPVCVGNVILDVYTVHDGQVVFSFGGWARNSYALLPDGSFLNQGSSGAIYSVTGIFALSEDGTSLDCVDFYFTYEKDETFEDVGVYYNTTGESDKSVSEALNMGLEELWQISDILHRQTIMIPMTSFADEFGLPSYVVAEWDDSEAREEAHVLFEPMGGTVMNFVLLSLQLEDIDEYGNPTYTVTDEKPFGDLNQNHPITVSITFAGDMPNNGIRYTDSTGTSKQFTLSISGEDGSLILTPF